MPVSKKKQNGTKQQAKSGSDNLFDNLNPNNLLNNAQKVISSAVNVLEEEIAAGILAAKRIEKKVINVDEVRDDSQNLMNRIRKDTHEALDIFLDALAALTKQLGALTDSVSKQNSNGTATNGNSGTTTATGKAGATNKTATASGAGNLQNLEHDVPVKPGSQVNFVFLLSEDELNDPLHIDFQRSDFIGPANQKVRARQIHIDPASFELKPGEEREIAIRVSIPATAAPGYYHSILTVNQMPAVKILLSFQVN